MINNVTSNSNSSNPKSSSPIVSINSLSTLHTSSGSYKNFQKSRRYNNYSIFISPIQLLKLIITTILQTLLEFYQSSDIIFNSKLTCLFIFGPLALLGDSTALLNEFTCFVFAGLALIPCAERLSFVTEQIASHTSQTIGALLNATFGNAPELLISTAALRSGFYRVVQLTLLGSILTNLLFVFGIACIVGGMQYKIQYLKVVSGNVLVGLLLVTTSGLLLPAALKLGHVLGDNDEDEFEKELSLSRINSILLLGIYCGYLYFQVVSHKEEFDDVEEEPDYNNFHKHSNSHDSHEEQNFIALPHNLELGATQVFQRKKLSSSLELSTPTANSQDLYNNSSSTKSRSSDNQTENEEEQSMEEEEEETPLLASFPSEKLLPLRAGLLWLLSITLCTSAMSDILIDTIDGFAYRLDISQLFTSVIIIPFFSNIAEQVSAFLFAYRNKMEIVIGVTVGSAIQISLGVIPGTILLSWCMDRSMSLFFSGYEVCCLVLGVLSVSAVLQSGSSNWLVGVYFVGTYFMIALGFWFHVERGDLSVDAEISIQNHTVH